MSSYEYAAKGIEQEKKMVAALKRLLIGHLMNYDPDLPPEDLDLGLEFDDTSLSRGVLLLRPSRKPSNASEDIFFDTEEDMSGEQLDPNEVLWVPAALHPEVAPEQFKKHIKHTVEELLEKKLSRDGSVNKRLSLSFTNDFESDDELEEDNQELFAQSKPEESKSPVRLPQKQSMRRKSTKSPRNRRGFEGKNVLDDLDSEPLPIAAETTPSPPPPNRTNSTEKAARKYHNPSLRELTTELEELSKLAGMDAPDAATLARSLSTQSIGYTDVEREAFNEMSSSPHSSNPESEQYFSAPPMPEKRDQGNLRRLRRVDYRKQSNPVQVLSTLGLSLQQHKASQLNKLRNNLHQKPETVMGPLSHGKSNQDGRLQRQFKTNLYQADRSLQMLFNYRNPELGGSPYGSAATPVTNLEGKLVLQRKISPVGQQLYGQLKTERPKQHPPPQPRLLSRPLAYPSTQLQQQQGKLHSSRRHRSSKTGPRTQYPPGYGQGPVQGYSQVQGSNQVYPNGQHPGQREHYRERQREGQNQGQFKGHHVGQQQGSNHSHYQGPYGQPLQGQLIQGQPRQGQQLQNQPGRGQPMQGYPYGHAGQTQDQQSQGQQVHGQHIHGHQLSSKIYLRSKLGSRSSSKQQYHPSSHPSENPSKSQVYQGQQLVQQEYHQRGQYQKDYLEGPQQTYTRLANHIPQARGLQKLKSHDNPANQVSTTVSNAKVEDEMHPIQRKASHNIKTQEINQDLDLLRLEINEFKESLNKNDPTVGSNTPSAATADQDLPLTQDPEFTIDNSIQDLSYEDSLGMERELVAENKKVKDFTDQDGQQIEPQNLVKFIQLDELDDAGVEEKIGRNKSSIKREAEVNFDSNQSSGNEHVAVVVETPQHTSKTDSSLPEPKLEGHVLEIVENEPHISVSLPSQSDPLVDDDDGLPSPTVDKFEAFKESKLEAIDESMLDKEAPELSPKKKKDMSTLVIEKPTSTTKKKKSWLWLKERSVLSTETVTKTVSTTAVTPRSVSNPEIGESLRTSSESLENKTDPYQGKENVISKLFKKKRSNSITAVQVSEDTDKSQGVTVDYESDNDTKKLATTKKSIFKIKSKKDGQTLFKKKSTGKKKEETSKKEGIDTSTDDSIKSREIDSEKSKLIEALATGESKDIALDSIDDDRMDADINDDNNAANQETVGEVIADDKPQTTQDVQEKLKKSIKRTSKANQPIEFTDSVFGFPLPPPSPSTLIMLDYRFPVHVERAIYRLSHLKLANPKRSLREQVLLSNFMYAYLNLVDHTLHLEQQMSQDTTEVAPAENEAVDQDQAFLSEDVLEDEFEGESIAIDLEIVGEATTEST